MYDSDLAISPGFVIFIVFTESSKSGKYWLYSLLESLYNPVKIIESSEVANAYIFAFVYIPFSSKQSAIICSALIPLTLIGSVESHYMNPKYYQMKDYY